MIFTHPCQAANVACFFPHNHSFKPHYTASFSSTLSILGPARIVTAYTMKYTILWIIIASLATSAFGRYLQPQPVGNISRVEYDVKLNPGTGADTPSTPGTPLSPDPPLAESASDDLWAKHVRKGNDLICGLCATDLGAGLQIGDTRTPPSAASRWAGDVVERTDWYWFEGMYEPFECEMDGFWGMGNMFRALGISLLSKAEGGDVQCFQLQHRNDQAKNPDGTPKDVRFQTYEIEGREYFVSSNTQVSTVDDISNMRTLEIMSIFPGGVKACPLHCICQMGVGLTRICRLQMLDTFSPSISEQEVSRSRFLFLNPSPHAVSSTHRYRPQRPKSRCSISMGLDTCTGSASKAAQSLRSLLGLLALAQLHGRYLCQQPEGLHCLRHTKHGDGGDRCSGHKKSRQRGVGAMAWTVLSCRFCRGPCSARYA